MKKTKQKKVKKTTSTKHLHKLLWYIVGGSILLILMLGMFSLSSFRSHTNVLGETTTFVSTTCIDTSTTYAIGGKVTSITGAAVQGYTIHIYDSTTNTTDLVITDKNGNFCDNTLADKYNGYAVRPSSMTEYGSICPPGYLCNTSSPSPSSYENQVSATTSKPNCATNCNFQFVALPMPTPTSVPQAPTATPPPGCYYTYSCQGIANSGCSKTLVCPTNVPTAQNAQPPIVPPTTSTLQPTQPYQQIVYPSSAVNDTSIGDDNTIPYIPPSGTIRETYTTYIQTSGLDTGATDTVDQTPTPMPSATFTNKNLILSSITGVNNAIKGIISNLFQALFKFH